MAGIGIGLIHGPAHVRQLVIWTDPIDLCTYMADNYSREMIFTR